MLNREEMLRRGLNRHEDFDLIVIGGGATGIGCALDAVSRGYSVLLLEQSDFGKGTSSKSTKLAHGGVRYLKHGNLSLVKEALRERAILRRNAPHVVNVLPFVIPCYSSFAKLWYGAGLFLYSILARGNEFGRSRVLSRKETIRLLPNVKEANLRGGVLYFDGQFDDSRLLINLAATAAEKGAVLLNYAKVVLINKNNEGSIDGVGFVETESGDTFFARAKCVVNATGAFSDSIRKMSDENSRPIIAASQGIHLVFDRKFLSGENALMIPKTSDGRVLFAIPWHDHLIVGTTETEIQNVSLEPRAHEDEISFVLETCSNYFSEAPKREDILSVFTGIRPLVKSGAKNTSRLSRDHFIEINEAKLLTITGGKWTTYRKMAQDAVDRAATIAKLPRRESGTREIRVHGFCRATEEFGDLAIYGSDVNEIQKLIAQDAALASKIHPRLPYVFAEVVWSVRNEMARTLEDVLARRTRALFLDAKAAIECAPRVVEIIAKELEKDSDWSRAQLEEFRRLAERYAVR